MLQETHFGSRGINRLRVKGWKKLFHANGNIKQAGVPIRILDKTDFKIKTVIFGHYISIKESIQEAGITNVNKKKKKYIYIYAPNKGAPQYIKQMLTAIKREIASDTTITGEGGTLTLHLHQCQIIQTDNQWGNTGLKWHNRPNGLNWYLYSIPPESRTHVLFKCTWNILQNRSYAGPQSK